MASESFVQPAIPHFDGHYNHWSMLMENFLRSKEYWIVVVSRVAEPTEGVVLTNAQRTKFEELKLKDLKAKNYLFQAIDRSILETILCKDTTKHIWDSMKKKYQELIEDEEEAKVEVEETEITMIVGTNNNIIVIKRVNFKEETEDVEATTQQLIDQSQKTSPMLNVTDVIDLKTNLLSVGQLQEKIYEIFIKDGVFQIQDAKLGIIAQVNMTVNRTFPLYLHNTIHLCFLAKLKYEAWLWHFRYGHLNFGGLKTLQQKNMVTGLPQIIASSQFCEECVVSKQHCNQFPQVKSWRAKKALELVHSDICGPIIPNSNGSKRYIITFIDDYSRKIWVYFLQEKSEAFVAFKSYKALVEKEVGNPIKFFRMDRGGEYNSHEFANFCENHGIRRQLTATYIPQQNGVCERKNSTIMNMVRSLLTTSGIPKSFWLEAVNWSIHILNRSPTLVVQNMTPKEAWSGRKLVVNHFRIFGCIAYAYIPDEKRRKLDNKGEKCIFLGVSDKLKAYKLYNPSTMKIVLSRDVVFDEKDTWSWKQNGVKENIPVDFDDDEKWQQPMENEQEEEVTQNVPIVDQSPLATESQRPQRVRKRPAWMTNHEVTGVDQGEDPLTYFAMFSDCDLIIFETAVKEPKWRKAMDAEIAAIERNDTWELCDLPKGQKTIGVKWVYKTKLKENGEVDKHKACLVAKGYKQEFGVDYKEVFASIARHDTIKLLDVKLAFLHGDLKEEVFIDQPLGYAKLGNEHKVYKLKKALYGLKQTPRAWYNRIETYFLKEGFQKCPYEHTLFIKIEDGGKMHIVCLYVDDLIYTGNNTAMFESFKKSMMAEFEMSDLGMMHYFLGIEMMQYSTGILISQKKYVGEILDRFQMKDCNPVNTPSEFGMKLNKDNGGKKVDDTLYKQIVGSLMYLTITIPDIMHVVSVISRYMEYPTEIHLLAAKRIFRYLKDSDYAGDLDDRKSTSGYVFMMGTGVVSWSSKKQPIVTLSSTEAEFVVAIACACQAIWLKKILKELHFKEERPTQIYCDNSLTIKLSKNPVLHGRSKHIDVKYH
uniref:Integrase catalytic domain-containing protein n=1 Tax=Vitis vinifera TaxID=29760 RepID=A5BIJ3_VITVI|nr:hypothetical protein VITISV_002860 [Vitis vinifera]